MPRRQPFTVLCQQAARLARPAVVDLHAHTTASDGDCTPSQVVALAREAGLAAVAITDHDTMAGLAEADRLARTFTTRPVAVVPGVEVSTELDGREYHVLGYFVSPDEPRFAAALDHVRDRRKARFRQFIDRLTAAGHSFPDGLVDGVEESSSSLGRRHLAKLLVRVGAVATHGDAFRGPLNGISVPADHRLPLADALGLIAGAGGVASLAHPRPETTRDDVAGFRALGLRAVEAVFPAASADRSRELRRWAEELGLRVTGGSDFHGNTGATRGIGTPGLPLADFESLCDFAGSRG